MDNNYLTETEGGDPLKVARIFSQSIHSLMVNYDEMAVRLEQSQLRIRELEQENERLQNEQLRHDLWSSRVTYENVVELIASYEDASQRDEARKLLEPLLKKEQVRQLRRDIRLKVKELESAEEAAEVPEKLQTAEAEEIWSSLREAGFVAQNGYGLANALHDNGHNAGLRAYYCLLSLEALGKPQLRSYQAERHLDGHSDERGAVHRLVLSRGRPD